MPASPQPPHFRRLSESEIQDRLYGEYHSGRRRRPADDLPPRPALLPPTPASVPEEQTWTGQEILTHELQRLSQELTTLRQERELLATELTRRRPASAVTTTRSRLWVVPRSWVMVGALLVASAGLAALCHTVVLEAQPPLLGAGAPGTVYSVQAGVYDVKILAERMRDTLSQEGYPVFLMEGTTRRGTPRYRVYVGRYASKVEAQVQLDLLKRNVRVQDSFILQRQ